MNFGETPKPKDGDRLQEAFDTVRKISERLGVLSRETTSFVDSLERITPTEKRTPNFRTLVEEGYNIFSLGKAKIERIKRDLEGLK